MRADNAILRWQWNEAMPKDMDFTKRIIPLFVIVSMLR